MLLLKATALGLRKVPQLNGLFENGQFRPGDGVHVGWAIALRGGRLVAPAIHHADQKSLPELMVALRELVQRAPPAVCAAPNSPTRPSPSSACAAGLVLLFQVNVQRGLVAAQAANGRATTRTD